MLRNYCITVYDSVTYLIFNSRNLKVFFLEESIILDKDGQWLHEIAMSNTVLETLNFYMTDLAKVAFQDLELISRNCRLLKSVKTSDWEIIDLLGFFRSAASLEEFGGGSYNRQPEDYSTVSLPATLRRVGLTYMGKNELPIVFPLASALTKLDLVYSFLETEDHCNLIRKCPNLEVLEVTNNMHCLSLSALLIRSLIMRFVFFTTDSYPLSYSFFFWII